MTTFKQLEALYWISKLGSFEAAALELHTTQSAISKRIQELEQNFGVAVFDRAARTARLTAKGSEMLDLASDLLQRRDILIDRMSSPSVVMRRVRIGVTEMTAMTWLPRWVQAIQPAYPRLTLEPEVLASNELRDRLAADRLDLIVVPDALTDPRYGRLAVGEMRHIWCCKPGLLDLSIPVSPDLLERMVLITQQPASSGSRVLNDMLRKGGYSTGKTLIANNVLSIVAMTLAGFGISYLPEDFVSLLVKQGRLCRFNLEVELPPMNYVALYHLTGGGQTLQRIAELAKDCCDFGSIFQPALNAD